MSQHHLRIVAGQTALPSPQMSRPKAFGPVAQPISREGFLRFWSGLMMRRCGDYRGVARVFDRTEQTGRNWIDGVACPTGLDVARAMALWPGEFAGLDEARDWREAA